MKQIQCSGSSFGSNHAESSELTVAEETVAEEQASCKQSVSSIYPIFFDPFGRRAPLTTFTLIVLFTVTLGGLAAAGMVGMLVPPSLGGILESGGDEVVGKVATTFRSADQGQIQINPTRNRQLPPKAGSTRRLAFMPDEHNAVASLRRNAGSLDGIIPGWLNLGKAGGLVGVGLDQRSDVIAQWVRANAPHLAIMPKVVTNLSKAETTRVLAHPETRTLIVSDILALVRQHDFKGLVLDLNELSLFSNQLLAALLQELGGPLRKEGRSLILSMRLEGDWREVQSVAPLVDYVLVQTHDQHQSPTDSGPPAKAERMKVWRV